MPALRQPVQTHQFAGQVKATDLLAAVSQVELGLEGAALRQRIERELGWDCHPC